MNYDREKLMSELARVSNLSPASIKAIERAVDGEGMLFCLNKQEIDVVCESIATLAADPFNQLLEGDRHPLAVVFEQA